MFSSYMICSYIVTPVIKIFCLIVWLFKNIPQIFDSHAQISPQGGSVTTSKSFTTMAFLATTIPQALTGVPQCVRYYLMIHRVVISKTRIEVFFILRLSSFSSHTEYVIKESNYLVYLIKVFEKLIYL